MSLNEPLGEAGCPRYGWELEDIETDINLIVGGREDGRWIDDAEYDAVEFESTKVRLQCDWERIENIKAQLSSALEKTYRRHEYLENLEYEYDNRLEVRAQELADHDVAVRNREVEQRAIALDGREIDLNEKSQALQVKEADLNSKIESIPNIEILSEVLVDLGLDVSPAEIEAKIRARFKTILKFKGW